MPRKALYTTSAYEICLHKSYTIEYCTPKAYIFLQYNIKNKLNIIKNPQRKVVDIALE